MSFNAPSPPPPNPGLHHHSLPPNPRGRPEPPGRAATFPLHPFHPPTAPATPPPSPTPPASTAVLPQCSFSVGTPLGISLLCQFLLPIKWGGWLFGFRSAKTQLRNQVLPDRLDGCLASRLDHRPIFDILPRLHTRPEANQQRHGGPSPRLPGPDGSELDCASHMTRPDAAARPAPVPSAAHDQVGVL